MVAVKERAGKRKEEKKNVRWMGSKERGAEKDQGKGQEDGGGSKRKASHFTLA